MTVSKGGSHVRQLQDDLPTQEHRITNAPGVRLECFKLEGYKQMSQRFADDLLTGGTHTGVANEKPCKAERSESEGGSSMTGTSTPMEKRPGNRRARRSRESFQKRKACAAYQVQGDESTDEGAGPA